MFNNIVTRLRTSNPRSLLWSIVLFSVPLSCAVTALVSFANHGRIELHHLVISGIVALIVPFVVAFILISLLDAVRIAEQEAEEERTAIGNLLENSAVGTFVINPAHEVIFWNSACEELTGYPARTLIGTTDHWKPFYAAHRQTLADIVLDGNYEDLLKLYERHTRSALIENGLHAEGWYANMNGKRRFLIFDAAPVHDKRGTLLMVIETLQDITAQKLLEESVAMSEDRLRTIIATEPECVKLLARDGTVLEMNIAGQTMLEADHPDQIVGRSMNQCVPSEYRVNMQTLLENVFQGRPGRLEFELEGLKGTRRWVETYASPLRNKQDEVYAMLAVTRDVTDRKRGEKRLLEQLQFIQLLMDTIPMPVFYKDVQGIYQGCNKAFAEFMGCPKEDIVGKSVYEMAPKRLADKYHAMDRELLGRPGVQIYEYAVKHADGTHRDVIFNKATYRDSHGNVAGLLGVMQDITERKRTEEALRLREAQLAESQRIARIGSWERDLITNRVAWSDELFRIFGFEPQEIEPSYEALLEVMHPDDRDRFQQTVREAILQKKSYVVDFRVTRKDGIVAIMHAIGEVVCDNLGKPVFFRGTAQDFTAQTAMEEALRESEERYRTLAEAAHDAIFIVNRRGYTEYINQYAAEQLRLRPDEIIGKRRKDLFPQEMAVRQEKNLQAVFQSGEPAYVEEKISLADREAWLSTRVVPFRRVRGEVDAVLGISRDITELKRLEQKLAQSESHLRAIIDTEPECVLIIAADGTLLEINPAGLAMLEAGSFDELTGRQVTSFVVSEHRHAFKALSEKTFGGESGMLEFEIVGIKGARRWLETHTAPLRNAQGHIFALLAVARDVTERKRADEKIRASEKKYRDLFESATDAIFVLDLEGNFIDVNKAAYTRLGYTKEEMLALHAGMLDPPEFAARVPERLTQIRERGVSVFESAHLRKDGTTMPVEVNSRMTEYGGRQVYFSIIRDITERKKAEQVIQRNYDAQTAINWILHISLQDIPLERILKEALDLILSISWLSIESKGGIFLVEDEPRRLVMKAQRGLPEYLREECKAIPFGKCLCGRAADRGEILFADSLDERHEIRYEGITPHGHYCVPIMHGKTVLGVMSLYLKEGHRRDEKEIEFLNAVANALAGIVQRKRTENEREKLILDLQDVLGTLSRSHREWQDTFDSITDMISIVDKDFTILKANRAFSAYYDLQPRDVIGRKCHEIVHDVGSPAPNCPHATTVKEVRPSGEQFYDKKTKKMFRIVTFPYHAPGGETIGSIHIMRDITEDKEKEMRLIMSERLAALGQMASGIAHEINNPLASIAGCSEGLLARVKKGRCDLSLFESYLSIIQEEVFRCKNITTAMLSFVRKTTYEKKDINLVETLDRTIEIIGFQGRMKNIEVVKKHQEPMPLIRGNEGELRQVLLVVIINALDAMQDKGTLTVETGVISSLPQSEGASEGYAVIRICDTGTGIPPEIIERIFDPFFTTKSDKGGTGLGLSIARKIVTNHNGRIEASPSPGRGTTFTITLPLP